MAISRVLPGSFYLGLWNAQTILSMWKKLLVWTLQIYSCPIRFVSSQAALRQLTVVFCGFYEGRNVLKYYIFITVMSVVSLLVRFISFFFFINYRTNASGDVRAKLPSSSSSTVTSDNMSSPTFCSATAIMWADSFRVPWGQIPSELCRAVANGSRLLNPDHCKMICVLVDEMRQQSKAQCCAVAHKIVKQYSKSFSEYASLCSIEEISRHSLQKEIKTHVEHLNRDNTAYVQRATACGRT